MTTLFEYDIIKALKEGRKMYVIMKDGFLFDPIKVEWRNENDAMLHLHDFTFREIEHARFYRKKYAKNATIFKITGFDIIRAKGE